MRHLWFKLYSRHRGILGSSGFEHVFLGEIDERKFKGMHNWIWMYIQVNSYSPFYPQETQNSQITAYCFCTSPNYEVSTMKFSVFFHPKEKNGSLDFRGHLRGERFKPCVVHGRFSYFMDGRHYSKLHYSTLQYNIVSSALYVLPPMSFLSNLRKAHFLHPGGLHS